MLLLSPALEDAAGEIARSSRCAVVVPLLLGTISFARGSMTGRALSGVQFSASCNGRVTTWMEVSSDLECRTRLKNGPHVACQFLGVTFLSPRGRLAAESLRERGFHQGSHVNH